MNQFSNLINERIEAMRRKLQDTSRRNPLINNVLNAKSAAFIRIVDEKPQSIFDHVVFHERKMVLSSLPPVDMDPPDEETGEFKTAFQNALLTDEAYLKVIDKIDFEYDEKAPDMQENADRALKDRVREWLEMPPRPKSEQFSDLINHAKSHGINSSSNLPLPSASAEDDRFDDNELQTLLLPKTFQSRLARILSKARMYQEERGLNVVYIVIGYLKWTLPNVEKQDEFKSPLLLLPVSLTKAKSLGGETYTVAKLSEPMLNPSLIHKLTAEAKLDLSGIKSLLEDETIDVEALFEAIADLKPKNMHWTVLREASFGIYPFQGIELYYDLDTKQTDFSNFPIVSELMVGKQKYDGTRSDFSESDVESSVGQKLVPHIVLDADSSQFISLLKVANNENVALEGPPGSGKSQTIVNAIANAIYSGKKVIFVAQKATALEVVLSRLKSLGLDQFVLPLMSGHGSTDEFYEAVQKRLELQSTETVKDLENLQSQYEASRDRLSEYIDILTRPVAGTGMSVHQVLGVTIANSSTIENLPLALRSIRVYPDRMVKDFGPSDLNTMVAQVADWYGRLAKAKIPSSSPWADAPAETLDTDVVNKALVAAGRANIEIETTISKLNPNAKHLYEACLDNTLKEIENKVLEVAKNEVLVRAHNLSFEMGKEEAGEALRALTDVNMKLTAFQYKLRITPEKMRLVITGKEKLIMLKEFASRLNLQVITAGTISSNKEDLLTRRTNLQKLMNIKGEIIDQISDQISRGLTIQHLIAYEPLLKDQIDIRLLKPHIQELGISGCQNEIRKVKKLLINYSSIFSVKEMPKARELSSLQSIIQDAGIFSFMSSTFKTAKKDAAGILRYVRETDPKRTILNGLIEAQEFITEWSRLALFDEVKISDSSLPERLLRFVTILDELEVINNRSGLNITSALQLLTLDKLGEALELLGNIDASTLSWSDIETETTLAGQKIDEIQNFQSELIAAENFFVSLGKSSVSDITDLAYNSDKLAALMKQRSETLQRLPAEFEDNEVAKQIFEAHQDYSELHPYEIDLLFKEEGHEFLTAIENLLPAFTASQNSFSNLISAKNKIATAGSIKMSAILENLDKHQRDHKGLNNLLVRHSVFAEAENAGLDDLIIKMEETTFFDEVESVAMASLAAALQDQIKHDFGSLLMQFDGTLLSAARNKIQELDRQIINLSKHEVTKSALRRSQPPNGIGYGKKSDYTELNLINHELQKQRRTPPRKILKRAQNALMDLFPCWMMVPTAVAQNLPKSTVFDLVIIDEASQMTPESSISALMRAKNAFIAGDTNQLPPTNFFKGLSVDEDEDEDVSTMEESILELANVQFHPKHRLLWHYRSKHEDLIAFSNHYVYDSELVIFPSPTPTTPGLGISLVEINGTFQRGVNPAEAQVMLEAIVQFMKDTPNRSLGVAVMNQSQMEQIEALVLREADTNKSVASYIDHWMTERQGLEKFFVKNLENVQGDERDVIFVGTVYGRDPQGKFYQRFGPINGVAGKRRLNVLFSRAKEQIVTFTSIPLGDFNPSPSNEGATLLRRWLEFSATKRLGEVAHNHDRAGHTDSPFEDHVIEAVSSLGYEAVPQVGVSSYFIDIGVKHPSYPLGYICGIECDGATYHSSKSARDRDRLREEVLSRLGWDLYRIWSTDWFRDPLGCREVLKCYLEERLAELIKSMPKIMEPKVLKPKKIKAPQQQPIRTHMHNVGADVTNVVKEPIAIKTETNSVRIGSKITIRYLDGPRAGTLAKFWFQKTTNDPKFESDGYTSLAPDKPLGEALEGGLVDDTLSYEVGDKEIRVQIIELRQS